MARQLVIASGLLIAFCAGIFFYAEWQKKQFDAALPKPPAQNPAAHGTKGHVHEHNVHEDDMHGDNVHAEEAPEPIHEEAPEHAHDVEPSLRITDDASSVEPDVETASNADPAPASATKPHRRLDPEVLKDPHQRVKYMREGLVYMHGEIPEIDTFLDLELKLYTAGVYSGADIIRHAELQAQLYPHPGNDVYLEKKREFVQEHGGEDSLFGPESPMVFPPHSH